MAVKGINPNSKCYVDVYTAEEIDNKFNNWSGLSSEVIPSNVNLNNYTKVGFYRCTTNAIANTVANSPTTNAFSLLVEEHAGIKQTVTRYQPALPTVWVRNCFNGTWGSWTKLNNTIEDPQIYSGTVTPSSALGKNGDVYFLY